MVRRGHEVHVLTTREPDDNLPEEDECDGVPILRLPFPAALRSGDIKRLIRLRRQFAALVADFRPDVLHIFYSGTLAMLALEGGVSAPLLSSFTMWPIDPAKAGQNTCGRLLRRSSWVTANSSRLVEVLRTIEPAIIGRSSSIYSGNPWPSMEPTPPSVDPGIILCMGRVAKEKGFDLMIRAMPMILRAFPNTQLRISGIGPALDELRTLAVAENCEDHVTFTGLIDPQSVSEAMNDCSFLVVPSRWEEAFASVAIQAMQMARACIATCRGGMAEAVIDQKTGFVVPPEDPDALATAAISLLGDSVLTIALGEAGRRRAREMFGWERYADDFDALYDHLARGGVVTS
jgi:glycosyltransferase involved in cell wall biosynthesis